jgi:hypothetical protein
MGRAGKAHIRQNHDLNQNYQKMEAVLQEIVK